MAKAVELRDMSDEQLGLTLKEANENLFRLRIKQQTERLDAPSELRRRQPGSMHRPSRRATGGDGVDSGRSWSYAWFPLRVCSAKV